ncbi:hypothetical protein [Halomicrococcus gelatinilyticus]|uniref:hypothetical protein n=1 Tax=Halomicrococcus gelatinilyticus TaxID=1702103 RepID=UPI002E10334C
MESTELTLYGHNREGIISIMGDILDDCREQGVEFDGPITPPTVKTAEAEEYYEDRKEEIDVPDWIRDVELDEDILAALGDSQQTIHARIIRIYGNSSIVKETAFREPPAGVSIEIHIDIQTGYSAGSSPPYTYDPSKDHVTDI